MNRTCENCRAGWFISDAAMNGDCRLHPPIQFGDRDAFPSINRTVWCLDWQAKEKPKVEGEKVKRKTVYPADFAPDERACNLAKGQGQNVYALAAAFKDHHVAKGSLFTDWQAAFRTWLRNDVAYKQKGGK